MSPPERDPGAASEHPGVLQYARHVNPAFVKMLGLMRYGRAFVRARDVWMWDHAGERYLDALACYGAVNIGHNHPRLLARLRRHLEEDALNFVHVGPSIYQGELAATLTALAGEPLEIAIFTSSGAEAVEAGIKMARAATGRSGIVYCEGGYHGTSLGTLSIMGEMARKRPFLPLLPECVAIPFGDERALERALKGRKAAAFVVDPGLCESGVLTAPPGYLARAQAVCRRYGTLMLVDEVQTGMGRTGPLFAFQDEGVVPDIVALAKSLSGGIAPMGATLTTAAIHKRAYGTLDRFDLQFTTFGGNTFSCIAALETLAILREEGLLQSSRAAGQAMLRSLRERLSGHPLVRDIRGRGLFLAIELGVAERDLASKLKAASLGKLAQGVFGQWVSVKLLERRIVCQAAAQRWNVLKVMPPLTLGAAEAEHLVSEICAVLGEYQGVTAVLKDVTERLGQQLVAGWSF